MMEQCITSQLANPLCSLRKRLEQRRLEKFLTGKPRRPGGAGYTLIELLVVLAILALLVGIATPMVLKYLVSAKVNVAHIQVENLDAALDLFNQDMDRYPAQQEGLQALIAAPDNDPDWHGPYLKTATNLKDPWGHAYNYRYPGQHKTYDLWSDGPHADSSDANAVISNW